MGTKLQLLFLLQVLVVEKGNLGEGWKGSGVKAELGKDVDCVVGTEETDGDVGRVNVENVLGFLSKKALVPGVVSIFSTEDGNFAGKDFVSGTRKTST